MKYQRYYELGVKIAMELIKAAGIPKPAGVVKFMGRRAAKAPKAVKAMRPAAAKAPKAVKAMRPAAAPQAAPAAIATPTPAPASVPVPVNHDELVAAYQNFHGSTDGHLKALRNLHEKGVIPKRTWEDFEATLEDPRALQSVMGHLAYDDWDRARAVKQMVEGGTRTEHAQAIVNRLNVHLKRYDKEMPLRPAKPIMPVKKPEPEVVWPPRKLEEPYKIPI